MNFHPDKDIWPFAHKVWARWKPDKEIFDEWEIKSWVRNIFWKSNYEYELRLKPNSVEIHTKYDLWIITRILTKSGVMLQTHEGICCFFGKENVNPMIEREQVLCNRLSAQLNGQ